MVQGQSVEATALPASVGLGRGRIAIGASFLRLLPDEQLVTHFRDGSEDAFRAIHDRYRARLFAYTRQMLNGTGQDPEDTVQDIFTRAYFNLRASRRELALRAWLYRIAHNPPRSRAQGVALSNPPHPLHRRTTPSAPGRARDDRYGGTERARPGREGRTAGRAAPPDRRCPAAAPPAPPG